jgi:sulfatase maturation enzyme AslB (radical SAM superfamily)
MRAAQTDTRPKPVMARFMRAIQFSIGTKLDGPDKPGHDEWRGKGTITAVHK